MRGILERLGVNDRASAWSLLWQFCKFGLVGLSNTGLSLLVYYVLIYLDIHYMAAHCAGFVLGVVNAFFWNSRYVFRRRGAGTFTRTFVAYGASFLVGIGFMWTMVELLGVSQLIVPVINLFLTVPLNFILNKFWAYQDTGEP